MENLVSGAGFDLTTFGLLANYLPKLRSLTLRRPAGIKQVRFVGSFEAFRLCFRLTDLVRNLFDIEQALTAVMQSLGKFSVKVMSNGLSRMDDEQCLTRGEFSDVADSFNI